MKNAANAVEQPFSKYEYIAEVLQSEIGQGCYAEAGRLPSEWSLCKRFRESRYTIRHALELLVYKGIVVSFQGKGYYLRDKPLNFEYAVTSVTRFSQVVRNLGRTPSAHVISADLLEPNEKVRLVLGLAEGERAFVLEILRCADEVPVALNITWVPENVCPNLLQYSSPFTSLYDLFETVYDIHVKRVSSSFQATHPTQKEAAHLQISPSTTILHIESVTRDDRMRFVEFTSAKYRGDLCRVSIDFD